MFGIGLLCFLLMFVVGAMTMLWIPIRLSGLDVKMHHAIEDAKKKEQERFRR